MTLTSPGRLGLNKERSNDLLGPEWAREALNCVLSREGRIAARKGWLSQTTGAIASTPAIAVLHEYVQEDGSTEVITAANDKIFAGITDYTVAGNDITPATTPTANNWQFVNFVGKVVGFQQGHQPIVYTGTGDFADLVEASGTAPTGNAAVAAFGRIWALSSDGQEVNYCGLLDETEWATSGGGGTLDLRNVWTQGTDQAVAIAAFGANLIVFGTKHIIFYADSSGSELGVDPDQLYVVDTIEGTGCLARDSLQAIGEGDLAFLSRHGVQLLGRVIREKSNPTGTITKNIRTYLSNLLSTQSAGAIRSAYSPEQSMYMLLLPSASRVIAVDTRFPFQDEDGASVYPILEWEYTTMPTALLVRADGDILLGFEGKVGLYSGNLDDAETYTITFSSPWLAMDPSVSDALKILKEIPTIVQLNASASISWTWEFDFNGSLFTGSTTYSLSGLASEFNVSEYSVDEYGGGLTLQARTVDGGGEGQFFRIGLQISIDSLDFVLQQIKLLFKIGRMAS